ncbi:MAG TPA: SIS domain-containing protein [Acidimicrobiales bacterium]
MTSALSGPLQVSEGHLAAVTECVASLGPQAARAAEWGTQLAGVLGRGGRLLVAGNGGSAAQAQHLTAELVGRYCVDRCGFSAICLTAETSSLTAIANDYGVEQLFARQVLAHGRSGDIVLCLSTSGMSANLLAAAAAGRQAGLTVWALTGRAPNQLAGTAHDSIAVIASSAATVQEAHLILVHVLCEAFDAALDRSEGRSR